MEASFKLLRWKTFTRYLNDAELVCSLRCLGGIANFDNRTLFKNSCKNKTLPTRQQNLPASSVLVIWRSFGID